MTIVGRIARRIARVFQRPLQRASAEHHQRFRQVLFSVRQPDRVRGRALVAYLCEPFTADPNSDAFRTHSNYWRSLVMANALCEMGYCIDVTSWRNPDPPRGEGYDLILGLGPAFTQSARERRSDATALYLGTGAAVQLTNAALRTRHAEFLQRHGVALPLSQMDPDDGPGLADRLLVVGNRWTIGSYASYSSAPINSCPNSVMAGVLDTRGHKNFATARQNFMWMAAYGALRRRLDVVLEAFAERPDLHIWVCGGIHHEKEFFFSMEHWLRRTPNIHYMSWLDVTSAAYQQVTARCGYILYPSCSDGMPGSVVNAMASGVVPIVTEESGIDVDGFGELLRAADVDSLIDVIGTLAEWTPGQLEQASDGAVQRAHATYARSQFESQFELALSLAGLRGGSD